MSRVIFSSILKLNFIAKVFKKLCFCQMKIVTGSQDGLLLHKWLWNNDHLSTTAITLGSQGNFLYTRLTVCILYHVWAGLVIFLLSQRTGNIYFDVFHKKLVRRGSTILWRHSWKTLFKENRCSTSDKTKEKMGLV